MKDIEAFDRLDGKAIQLTIDYLYKIKNKTFNTNDINESRDVADCFSKVGEIMVKSAKNFESMADMLEESNRKYPGFEQKPNAFNH